MAPALFGPTVGAFPLCAETCLLLCTISRDRPPKNPSLDFNVLRVETPNFRRSLNPDRSLTNESARSDSSYLGSAHWCFEHRLPGKSADRDASGYPPQRSARSSFAWVEPVRCLFTAGTLPSRILDSSHLAYRCWCAKALFMQGRQCECLQFKKLGIERKVVMRFCSRPADQRFSGNQVLLMLLACVLLVGCDQEYRPKGSRSSFSSSTTAPTRRPAQAPPSRLPE